MANFPNITTGEVKECLPNLGNIQYINKGGQKIVFKAENNNKEIVIKFFYLGELGEEEIEINMNSNFQRIKREIELLRSATSEFLPVISVIEPDKFKKNGSLFLYYSEEYINGSDLKGQKIDNIEIVRVAEHIIQAIEELWNIKKAVHRDIKPGNIMYDKDKDCYKLIDLGIAFCTLEPSITIGNRNWGTTMYKSPEQIKGRRRDLDFRSDLFSLGIVLNELISGIHPFYERGMNEFQIQRAIVHEKPLYDLQSFEIDIPTDFIKFVNRLISKHPHQRFSSFKKMKDILSNIKAG